MKSTVSKSLVVCVALSCLAAFGTLAQDQKKEITEQDIKKFLRDSDKSPLKEWTVLRHTGSVSEASNGSPAGKFRIRNFETEEPYAETLKFYAEKCKLPFSSEKIEEAAAFKLNSGHGFSFKDASLSVQNLPDAQSSTFVQISPDHTLSVVLYRPLQTKRTHVTITRIALAVPDKPQE